MEEAVFTLREPETHFRRELKAAAARLFGPYGLALAGVYLLNWEHLPPAYTAMTMLACSPFLAWVFIGPVYADRRLWRRRAGRDLVLGAERLEIPAYLFRRPGPYHQAASRQDDGALHLAWADLGQLPESELALDLLDAAPGAVSAALRRRGPGGS